MLIVEKDGLKIPVVEKGENKLNVYEVNGLTVGIEVYELVSEPKGEKGKKGAKGLNGKNELDGKNDGNRLVGKVGVIGLIGFTVGLSGLTGEKGRIPGQVLDGGIKSACVMAAQRNKILKAIKNTCNFLIIHNPPYRFYGITNIDIINYQHS